MIDFNIGDIAYAGYPTAYVYDFRRNSKGKLALSKVRHLLWGDWIRVTDYDYLTSDDADVQGQDEEDFVTATTAEMVSVRVRGRSGYMHAEDLLTDRLLEVVFVDVGQGDGALLVTPDDKKYVIDAGVSDNMYRYLYWRFSEFDNAHTDFDGLIVSHPDKDHYYGFNRLVENEEVAADNIWHNGLVEQFGIKPNGDQSTAKADLLGPKQNVDGQGYLTGLIETDDDLVALLADQKRWIKESTQRAKEYPELLHGAVTATAANGDRRFPNVSMLSTAHGEISNGRSYLPGFGPANATECVIEVIAPVVEPDANGVKRLRVFKDKPVKKTTSLDTGKTKNGHSVLLKLMYKDFTLFFGGDLNSSAEMFLLNHYTGIDVYDSAVALDEVVLAAGPIFGADVAKACHHGSADFTDTFLETMNPAVVRIYSLTAC